MRSQEGRAVGGGEDGRVRSVDRVEIWREMKQDGKEDGTGRSGAGQNRGKKRAHKECRGRNIGKLEQGCVEKGSGWRTVEEGRTSLMFDDLDVASIAANCKRWEVGESRGCCPGKAETSSFAQAALVQARTKGSSGQGMEVMDERRETTFCARKHSPELLPSLPPVGPSAAPHAQQHPSRIETENTYHDPNAALTTKSITLSMEDVNEDQALESRKLGRFPPPGHGRLVKESSLSLSHNYLYTVAESNESDQDASVHLPPEVSCGDPVSGFLPFNQCEVAIYDDDNPVEVEGDFTSTMTGNLYRGTFCGKEVLVKRLKSSDVGDPTKPVYKDLLLEAKIMTMVGMHKNVAFLHGVQMSEFLMPNLIIDKPGGPNLQDFFGIWREKHKGGLKKPTIFAWSKDLLRGLSYLHERSQPILHRDIRPANLRLSEDLRTLKIYGFEAATMVGCMSRIRVD
eukprot:755710-Hanusia_phi.AAC.4